MSVHMHWLAFKTTNYRALKRITEQPPILVMFSRAALAELRPRLKRHTKDRRRILYE